jgi:hypothetical protein
VLDKDPSYRDAIGSRFRYRLSGVPIDSPEVAASLGYASVPKDILILLKGYADRSGCISIGRAVSDSYPWEIEIGYARRGMSKYIFREFKDGVNVTDLVSRPPWRDDYLSPLAGNWVLVIGKPAF